MVVEVYSVGYGGEVLDELAIGDVALQLFYVFLDGGGFVRDGEVEGVVAKAELQHF